jgi:hypothetical protein
MNELGLRCDLHLYDGREHGFFNHTNPADHTSTVAEMDQFLVSLGFLKAREKEASGKQDPMRPWESSAARNPLPDPWSR